MSTDITQSYKHLPLSIGQGKAAIREGEAHIWCVSLDRRDNLYQKGIGILSPSECERASRFRFSVDRDRYLAAHIALRDILGRYLGANPASIMFESNAFGKPFISGEHRQVGLSHNLSHSEQKAVIALTLRRQIGVDIEYIRPELVNDEIAMHTFSCTELNMYQSLAKELRVWAFYNCWTRKEAYIKARGAGLSTSLDRFAVSLAPGDPSQILTVQWDPMEPSRWTLIDLDLGPEYAGCLAIEGRSCRLIYRHWAEL